MRLADIHLHTTRSDGWWDPIRLAEAAVERGLDAIAITDHDDIEAGLLAMDHVARRGLQLTVYAGAEVSTREQGRDVHILGIGLQRPIRPWQSIEVTLAEIVAQGGVPVIPHPKADPARSPSFQRILSLPMPVGVEVYNAASEDFGYGARKRGEDNLLAREFYAGHGHVLLGAVGGTDGHFRTVGRGLTAYEGDLLAAIRERRTAVVVSPGREHLMPWDLYGYWSGLKRMAIRRRAIWGPDRPNG